MEEKRRKELDAILDEWLGVTNDVKEMARGRRPACAEILRDPDEVDWDRVRERASAMAKRFCELDLCSYGALAYLSDDEWSGVGSDRRALLYEVLRRQTWPGGRRSRGSPVEGRLCPRS